MQIKEKILFLDTETGGLDPEKHSLLSIGLVAWEDSIIKDEKEIFISKKKYVVTDEALQINNINLDELKEIGISEEKTVEEIVKFIKKNFTENEKVIICGHNVNFDIAFLKKIFNKTNYSFRDYFSHRVIDTASIFKYLSLKGETKKSISSLDDAISYFKLETLKRHTALEDARITANIFTHLICNEKL